MKLRASLAANSAAMLMDIPATLPACQLFKNLEVAERRKLLFEICNVLQSLSPAYPFSAEEDALSSELSDI